MKLKKVGEGIVIIDELTDKIMKLVNGEFVDFFGVADLSLAKKVIFEQGGSTVSDYPLAVSVGIKLPNTVVDDLRRRHELGVAVNYRTAYEVTNLRLDIITGKFGSLLQNEGYRALPLPVHARLGEKPYGIFSHKLAANLAGLGWIGKSCLLITPEVGPRVRWATILTDAPLTVTGNPMEVKCGECDKCVEICPVSAFTGEPFKTNEPLEVRYDAQKCEKYLYNAADDFKETICGLCVYICPYGKKNPII